MIFGLNPGTSDMFLEIPIATAAGPRIESRPLSNDGGASISSARRVPETFSSEAGTKT